MPINNTARFRKVRARWVRAGRPTYGPLADEYVAAYRLAVRK